MRWIVVIAAMAAKRQRTDAQQCGESALPYEVATYAFTITARDGHAIDARVYAPAAKETFLRQELEHGVSFAGVIYAHGGCFAEGDCESFEELNRGFARRGLLVLSTSFRQGATNPHPGALYDLGDVAAWAHEAFPDLAWGVSGSSSGGFFALALAADPERWGAGPGHFAFTLALCPVADPLARANYLRAVINGTSEIEPRHEPERARQILASQLSYFPGGDDQMWEAAGLVNEYAMGQTFVVAGGQDKNVPLHVLSKVIPRANRTLVLGTRGHDIQAVLQDQDYDEIIPWLREAVRDQEEFEEELLEMQRSKRSKS